MNLEDLEGLSDEQLRSLPAEDLQGVIDMLKAEDAAPTPTPTPTPTAKPPSPYDVPGSVGGDIAELGTGAWDLAKRAGNRMIENQHYGLAAPLLSLGQAMFADPGGNSLKTAENVARTVGRSGMEVAGIGAGAKIGAGLGSMVAPGPGTVMGAGLGAGVGMLASGSLWDRIMQTLGFDRPTSPGEDLGQMRKDLVQNLTVPVAKGGLNLVAPKVAGWGSALRDRALPPGGPPKVPDVEGILNDPASRQAMNLGYELTGTKPSAHEIPLPGHQAGQALEQGTQQIKRLKEVPTELTRAVGSKLGVGESQGSAQRAMYQRWNGGPGELTPVGKLAIETGLLQKVPRGGSTLAEAAYSEGGRIAQKKAALAIELDAKLDAPILFDDLAPNLVDITEKAKGFAMLGQTTGIGKSIADNLLQISDSIANLPGGGMTASQAVKMTELLNFYEREVAKAFDNAAFADKANFQASMDFSAATQAMSAARDAINARLGELASQKLGAPNDAFHQLNQQLRAYHLLEDVGGHQAQVMDSGRTAVGARRVTQTEGDSPTIPNAFSGSPRVAIGLERGQKPSIRMTDLWARYNPWRERPTIDPPSEVLERANRNILMEDTSIGQAQSLIRAQGMEIPKPIEKATDPGIPRKVGGAIGEALRVGARGVQVGTQVPSPLMKELLVPVEEHRRMPAMLPRGAGAVTQEALVSVLTMTDPFGMPIFVKDPMVLNGILGQLGDLYAKGDKDEIAAYIGELTRQFPQLPIAKGPISGLPSEMPIEAGRSKLLHPEDIAKMEARINLSPLSSREKAKRIHDLQKYHFIYPWEATLASEARRRSEENPNSSQFQYAPRTNGRREP